MQKSNGAALSESSSLISVSLLSHTQKAVDSLMGEARHVKPPHHFSHTRTAGGNVRPCVPTARLLFPPVWKIVILYTHGASGYACCMRRRV